MTVESCVNSSKILAEILDLDVLLLELDPFLCKCLNSSQRLPNAISFHYCSVIWNRKEALLAPFPLSAA